MCKCDLCVTVCECVTVSDCVIVCATVCDCVRVYHYAGVCDYASLRLCGCVCVSAVGS